MRCEVLRLFVQFCVAGLKPIFDVDFRGGVGWVWGAGVPQNKAGTIHRDSDETHSMTNLFVFLVPPEVHLYGRSCEIFLFRHCLAALSACL